MGKEIILDRRQLFRYGLLLGIGAVSGIILDEARKTRVPAKESPSTRGLSSMSAIDLVHPPLQEEPSIKYPPPMSAIDLAHPPLLDPVTKTVELDGKPEMNKSELMDFIIRMDKLTDFLPEVKGPTSKKELKEWAREIVPFFEYEGVTYNPTFPTDVEFEEFSSGQAHNHVLGQAYCLSGKATLNARVENPQSSWFGREDSIQIWVHELTHIQGVCIGDNEEVESSAQIISLEIMAAMVNYGNTKMVRSLFESLEYMAVSSLYYLSLQDNSFEEFVEFRNKIYDDPILQANFQKSVRYWAEKPGVLSDILRKYNYIPFEKIAKGLKTGQIEVMLPINNKAGYDYPAYYGGTNTPKENKPQKSLKCDDLIYVLTHAEEIAEKIRK